MIPPDDGPIDGDGTSRYPEKSQRRKPALPPTEAAEHSPSRTVLTAAGRQLAPRLHEPFVSPEFAKGMEKTARTGERSGQLGDNCVRFSRGIDSNNSTSVNTILSHTPHPEVPPPHAAPLYTVRAGGSPSYNSGLLMSPPTSVPYSPLLEKKSAVIAAGCSSVLGPSSTAAPPASCGVLKAVGGGPEQARDCLFKPNKTTRPAQSSQAGDQVKSQLSIVPRDLSPVVASAVCTWGQELVKILGQHVIDSAIPSAGDHTMVPPNTNGRLSVLTTTGNFPQTMQLRFSCPVQVTSVHIRASSVLRLIVHPSDGLLGDRHADGKTVMPQEASCMNGESLDEAGGDDIDIDVRGIASFESTRSLSVTITAGSRAFCNVGRIYALGTRV